MDWTPVRALRLVGGPSLRELLRQPPVEMENYIKQKFKCTAEVKRLLTYERTSAWIKSHPLHRHSDGDIHDQDLVGRIVDKCCLMFAILVDAELEFLTFTLLSKGNSDESLGGIDYSILDLNHDEQQRLTERCYYYCPVLRQSTHLQLTGKMVLPFIKRDVHAHGAYGIIYRIKVVEGHLEGYDTVETSFSPLEVRIANAAQKSTVAEKSQDLNEHEDDKPYLREVETLQKRQHPNIVPLLASYTLEMMDSGSVRRSLHFITPLAQMDLAEWMMLPQSPPWLRDLSSSKRRGCLYRFIYALVSGLSFLHREKDGIITAHHDLKPKNILVFGQNLMIADFGKSHLRHLTQGSETQNDALGTYEYQPPEYSQGDGSQTKLKHGRSFDIWSMGCIIIELATLIVHGWKSKKLADFRNQRRQSPVKTIPELKGCDKHDESFHNNWLVVKKWIRQLQIDDGSRKLKSTLDVALQMMNRTRESRLYAWEAEWDLYNIQRPDDPLVRQLENGSLCVQSPTPQRNVLDGAQTPLHRAAQNGDQGRINQLLDVGWPSNIRNHNGLTAWEVLKQTQDSDFCENLRPRLAPTTSNPPENEEQGQKSDQEQAIKAQVTEGNKELAKFVGRQEGEFGKAQTVGVERNN